MIKLFRICLLAVSQVAQAAVIFGDGAPLNPMPVNAQKAFLEKAGNLHLLPRDNAQLSFREQLSDQFYNPGSHYGNLQMTQIPQTTWDLFMILQYFKNWYKVPDVAILTMGRSERVFGRSCAHSYIDPLLNNDFIRMVCDGGLADAFTQRNFVPLTTYFMRCIQQHLTAFNAIFKAYAREGERTPECEFDQRTLVFFFFQLFPEVCTFLERATAIEEDCLRRDLLPLWRHANSVQSAPLVRVINANNGEDDSAEDDSNGATEMLHFRTRGFGYSPLACFIGDGTLASVGDYQGMFSACSFSYFAQLLRDQAYATSQNFPYYVDGQIGRSKPEIQAALAAMANNVTCTILNKGTLNLDAWYLPQVFANNLVFLSGDACHPRLKGTLLHRAEERREFECRGINVFRSESTAEALAAEFMQLPVIWVSFKGRILGETDTDLMRELEAQRLARIDVTQIPIVTERNL